MNSSLQLIAILHRATQLAESILEEATERRLSARQAHVLAVIADSPGKSQTYYVEATGIDRSTFGQMCQRLARKHLISRRRTKEDSRAYALKLTDEGQDALRYIDAAAGRATREIRKSVHGLEHLRVAEPLREAAE